MPFSYQSSPKTIIAAAVIMAAGSVYAGPKDGPAASKGLPQKSGATASARKKARPTAPAPSSCTDERLWYCGVSAEDRDRALTLYEKANQLFDDSLFPAAVTNYRAAIVHWSHPAIQYNLMLALVALNKPIEAYQASIEALRFGAQALKPDEYSRAVSYQKLLRGQIASLEVRCDEPDALVSLDGKELLRGAGKVHIFVRPGKHDLVARKDGYLTTHHALVAVSDKPLKIGMRLLPQADALVPMRRWPAWRPWAAVGAGIGLGLAGGYLEWQANHADRSFQNAFKERCEAPDGAPEDTGCLASDYTREMKIWQQRSTWYRRLGHGASLASGVAILSGLAFVYLNREQNVENPERQNLTRISVIPSITSDAGGLALHLSF